MSVEVLAITRTDDAHIPFVQNHLDTEILVLDPTSLIEGAELSYELNQRGQYHITYQGTKLDNLKGVWFRKPERIAKKDLPVSDEYRDYSYNGVTKHIDLLKAEFRDATWVPGYYEMWRASNKALQLQMAHKVGLNVPATLITSNGDRAKQFLDTHGPCIVKPLTAIHPRVDGNQNFFFATKINKDNPPRLDGLHLAPAIFQEAIDPDYDVRVNVVGNKVFATTVLNEGLDESAVRDWRIGHFEGVMKFEAYELPTDVAERCVQLTKRLGMSFGVIDLVKDKKGTYWFLEDNPNGQWAFIEDHTGQPIGKAVAELLVRGPS